ncbi:MAG TPA: D-glycero-beta-D-manno-heptose 1-phosphate adenylyltransferase [Candidatus Xenobia bacterium]|jgi:rfaE bifunctional protein nucleotidyltransferase chain/domain
MTGHKVQSTDHVAHEAQGWRSQGKSVVFTNGCFDLLHVGHVQTLETARSFGDVLIVGVNSDASVKRLKGERRPLVPEQDRARVIAALACVDRVVIFDESTPVETIDSIRPDIHVKGGDYTGQVLPEEATVKKHGGEVRFITLVENRSTTRLVSLLERE